MRVFIAGIIQGGLADSDIHPQDYRTQITAAVVDAHPDAQVVDPHADNPDRLDWDRHSQSAMFLRYVSEAGRCDLLIAWLPEPSMGTAVEMYEAHRSGVPVITVSPMTSTWAVFSLAERNLPDIAALTTYLNSPQLSDLVAAGQAARTRRRATS